MSESILAEGWKYYICVEGYTHPEFGEVYYPGQVTAWQVPPQQGIWELFADYQEREWLKNLPFGNKYDPPEIIVCAANSYGNTIIPGVRHADAWMSSIVSDFEDVHMYLTDEDDQEQGFLTNKGRWVDRQEAWKIAVKARQIIRRVGGDTAEGGTLYSENLY